MARKKRTTKRNARGRFVATTKRKVKTPRKPGTVRKSAPIVRKKKRKMERERVRKRKTFGRDPYIDADGGISALAKQAERFKPK